MILKIHIDQELAQSLIARKLPNGRALLQAALRAATARFCTESATTPQPARQEVRAPASPPAHAKVQRTRRRDCLMRSTTTGWVEATPVASQILDVVLCSTSVSFAVRMTKSYARLRSTASVVGGIRRILCATKDDLFFGEVNCGNGEVDVEGPSSRRGSRLSPRIIIMAPPGGLMCRLPSYSPITSLLLDVIETSRCSDHDLTVCAYDAVLGNNRGKPSSSSHRGPVHDKRSAVSRMTTDFLERLFRRPR